MSRTKGLDRTPSRASTSDEETRQESETHDAEQGNHEPSTSAITPTSSSTESPAETSNAGEPEKENGIQAPEPGHYRVVKAVVKEFCKQSGIRLGCQTGRGKGRGKSSTKGGACGSSRSDDLHKTIKQTIALTRGKTLHQIILELMEGLNVNLSDPLQKLLNKITDMEEKIRIGRRSQEKRRRSLIHLVQIDEESDQSDHEEDDHAVPSTPQPASTPSPSSSQKRGLKPTSMRFSSDSDSSQLRESTKEEEDSFTSDGEVFLSFSKRTANAEQFQLSVDLTRARTDRRTLDDSTQEGRELAGDLDNEIRSKNSQLMAACAKKSDSSEDSVFFNPDRKRPTVDSFENSQPPHKRYREDRQNIIDEAATVIFDWLDKIPTITLCITLATFLVGDTVETTVRKVKRFVLQALLDMEFPESYWDEDSISHGLDPEFAAFLRENGWREILQCVHRDSIVSALNKLASPTGQQTEEDGQVPNVEDAEEDTAPEQLSSPASPDAQEGQENGQAEADPLVPLGLGLVMGNPVSISMEQHLAMQEELENLMPNDNFPQAEETGDENEGEPNLIIDISDEENHLTESDSDTVEIIHDGPPLYSVNEDSSEDEEN